MSEPGENGSVPSLKHVAATLLGAVHTRLELLSTELEEEQFRLVSMLVLGMLALFCLGVGGALLVLLLVLAFWDERIVIVSVLAVLFVIGAVAAASAAARRFRTKPRLFSASLAELEKDEEALNRRE